MGVGEPRRLARATPTRGRCGAVAALKPRCGVAVSRGAAGTNAGMGGRESHRTKPAGKRVFGCVVANCGSGATGTGRGATARTGNSPTIGGIGPALGRSRAGTRRTTSPRGTTGAVGGESHPKRGTMAEGDFGGGRGADYFGHLCGVYGPAKRGRGGREAASGQFVDRRSGAKATVDSCARVGGYFQHYFVRLPATRLAVSGRSIQCVVADRPACA